MSTEQQRTIVPRTGSSIAGTAGPVDRATHNHAEFSRLLGVDVSGSYSHRPPV